MPARESRTEKESSVSTTRRTAVQATTDSVVAWWGTLETDWKSVACALSAVGLVVVFDVPIPG